ncbi:MAG: substrate-binding domain-containing protein [Candidatus Aenigmarchaeota archaeon]|nr:substrate-binding domain-containing protein [Candidatus Aenigmarchaeota archaeon]
MKGVILQKAILLFLVSVVFVSGCVSQDSGTGTTDNTQGNEDMIVIGFSLSDLRVERWQRDRDFFTEKAEELGASVIAVSADLDADIQESQAENLILQGVDALVIVAHDGEKAASIVEKAHEAGIQVIAYDRLIKNCDLDYYISFDNVKVGEYEAKGVLDVVSEGDFAYLGGSLTDNNAFLVKEGSFNLLQPKIDSGEINLVLDVFNDGWKSEEAYRQLKAYLEENGTVDAVVCANDGTAMGAIQALEEFNLSGIPVSGQDASLGACQMIAEGRQTISVYKPLMSIAEKAAEMAVAIAKGETAETNQEVDNGEIEVPSYLLDVRMVTRDNLMSTVIADGFHSYEDVYQNVPESERPERN